MRLKLALLLAAALTVLALPITAGASVLGSRSAPTPERKAGKAEPEEAEEAEEEEGEEEYEQEPEEGEEEDEFGLGAEALEKEAAEEEEAEEEATVQASSKGSTSTTDKSAKECLVPQLRHQTLASATTDLSRAHCKLGQVDKPHGEHAHELVVVSQSEAHGRKLRAGTTVTVRLGPGKPRR